MNSRRERATSSSRTSLSPTPAVHRFSITSTCTIEAGETIALTGPNGAGKSTLVHLLMRFMEPQPGAES